MRDGERSYRSLLVAVVTKAIVNSHWFVECDMQAQADMLAAVRWLAALDDNVCPFVTDEEMARNLAMLRDIRAASIKESAR